MPCTCDKWCITIAISSVLRISNVIDGMQIVRQLNSKISMTKETTRCLRLSQQQSFKTGKLDKRKIDEDEFTHSLLSFQPI